MNGLIADLKTTAEGFVRQGTEGKILCEIVAFMRYRGQGWEIPVPLPDRAFTAADVELIRTRFLDAYARFFGRAIDGLSGLEIEIVTISVKAADERPAPEPATLTHGSRSFRHRNRARSLIRPRPACCKRASSRATASPPATASLAPPWWWNAKPRPWSPPPSTS
ncbi:hypothetical protein ACFSHQ_26005 [Gemmobacter lanyuensis]